MGTMTGAAPTLIGALCHPSGGLAFALKSPFPVLLYRLQGRLCSFWFSTQGLPMQLRRARNSPWACPGRTSVPVPTAKGSSLTPDN